MVAKERRTWEEWVMMTLVSMPAGLGAGWFPCRAFLRSWAARFWRFARTRAWRDGIDVRSAPQRDGAAGELRPSLALDLIEEMRPVIVDATVIRLVRTNQITLANFTSTEEHGCRLDDAGRRAFLSGYERRMLTLVHHPAEGRRIPWRHALNAQARRIAAVIAGRA
jgi:hypothetical protein